MDLRKENVKHCAVCGEDHNELVFFPHPNPADEWKWWAPCPNQGQTIWMRDVPDAPEKPQEQG